MKVLREVNPKLGQSIIIYGLNFFTILLFKLIELSGARVHIIHLKEEHEIDGVNYKQIINEHSIINPLHDKVNNFNVNTLIISSEISNKENIYLEKINFEQKFLLNKIPIYDVGYDDSNYKIGIKYPYPYVRWDYQKNLKYFIYLIEKNILNSNFFEIDLIEFNSIDEISEILNKLNENKIYLFKYVIKI